MGHRPGAVVASRRLGLDAVVVVGSDEAVSSSAPVEVLADAERASIAALAARLGEVDRVVALTEKMVVPAARLRARLGCPGVTPAVARRGHDKLFMKQAFASGDVPCARSVPVEAESDPEAIVAALGLPLVLKDRTGSGSRGTTLATDLAAVRAGLRDHGLAEAAISGEEMSYEALVVDGAPIFENPTQYLVPFWANVVPAPIDEARRAALSARLRQVLAAVGLRSGMVHVEAFISSSGVTIGEVALRPPGGHLMRLIEAAYGFDPWEALLRIELGERPSLRAEPSRVAGAWLFHPGPGVVDEVLGLEGVEAMPAVRRLRCAARPGDALSPRLGSGQAVGSVLCVAETHAALVGALRRARDTVRFRVDGELRAADAAPFEMAEAKRWLDERSRPAACDPARNRQP
jgi:biotin carboxylase